MKNYLIHHPWKIIEDEFYPDYNKVSESIFSLVNGRFGGRGNFKVINILRILRNAHCVINIY